MAFANAAEAGIAAHLSDRVDSLSYERRADTHTGGGRGGLATCVPSADDNDTEVGRSAGEIGRVVVTLER